MIKQCFIKSYLIVMHLEDVMGVGSCEESGIRII